MNQSAIVTRNLTRDFKTVCAVDDLTIEVPAGTVFGFLGPNGAGKTTTIRLLLGLLEPTSGKAEVLGYDTRTRAEHIRQHCGSLLEHHGLYERLSAEDNLEFYGRAWRIPVSERKARMQELLTHLGLWERRKELTGTWSRGMKQKLAVARALLHRPSLVFMDEPTAGLDPIAAAALRDDLASLADREGVTVFLTTHNLAEAEKLCQRVGVIRQGRLLAMGSPDELRRSASPRLEITGRSITDQAIALLQACPEVATVTRQNSHLLIELRQDADTAPLVSLLVGAGAEIEEVRRGRANLEEVFLTMMEEEK
ncbi:MAG: ABC transporter ATP-binding protein [Anaerolineales bacterium]|nr:ABC transporter ATP-binding protein [Anaerolineales bacterium]